MISLTGHKKSRPLKKRLYSIFHYNFFIKKKQIPYVNTYIWNLNFKKNGSDETRDRTGIKTQMKRMDLRTQGGGRVSWDKVREWHGHIYTTKCKIDG